MRYKLIIEYAGTRYSGWQIQKNARTIQGEIDQAVRTVTGRTDFELGGSGRTDAGVHALAQVAHLDVVTSLGDTLLQQRLNAELPADINILALARAPRSFHSRHSAQSRCYLYQIARRRTAFAKPFVWWVKEPLDLVRMREAAGSLVGMRDFQSFAAADRRQDDDGDSAPPTSTLVAIERVDDVESGDLVLIGIEGSHFLWRMVRRIVGVLVEMGTGRMEVGRMQRLLTSTSDLPAKLTAPASGLFLARVFYPGDSRERGLDPATPVGRVSRD
ncbi:MAG: tRNA pseudouridine(38-40) synthase TruA [Vicinamibacterales bacterium]